MHIQAGGWLARTEVAASGMPPSRWSLACSAAFAWSTLANPRYGKRRRSMSIYEILAVCALAGALGYAFYLYRSDLRSRARGSGGPPTAPANGGSMFGRDPKERGEMLKGSDPRT